MGENIFLTLEKINKSFSSVKVLQDVSLTVKEGGILGLVGENGAGKSTLMNILGGVVPKDSGEILINGTRFEPHNPREAEKAGIAFIHQELSLFTNLSVKENIFIEDLPKNKFTGFISYKNIKQTVSDLFQYLCEDVNINSLVSDLYMGQRQMVEIAKALTKNAKIIIFDEPTTSLSNREKEKLFKVIKDLSSKGVSIIYISHVLDEIFNHCYEIAVLRDGQIIGQEQTENLTKERVIKMMVGREMQKLFPYIKKTSGKELLRIRNLHQGKRLTNINVKLHAGEVVGLFGLMGAGRSELARAVFGIDKVDGGEVFVDGQKMSVLTPEYYINKGVAFITENRRDEGLLLGKSVKENLVLACVKSLAGRFLKIDRVKENALSRKMVDAIKIKTFDLEQAVLKLSGGNQQKVVIGKWLLTEPEVFILDEPTRGIDVGAKYEIYLLINKLAEEGSTVLFISSEMDELIGLCDRILIMRNGEISGELGRKDFDQEEILRFAIGKDSNYVCD